MTASRTFDVNALINRSRTVLNHPTEASFQTERPNVNLQNALAWLVLTGAIFGFLYGLGTWFYHGGNLFSPIGGMIGLAIGLPISFAITAAVLYVVARLLGGTGDFSTQAYLQSLYFLPLFILIGVARLVPYLDVAASIVGGVYSLYLTTLALRVTHNYPMRQAVLTWAIPLIVLAVLGACSVPFAGSAFYAIFSQVRP